MWQTLIMIGMLLTAAILILLILVQRGKGGGLAGALGGMGGQSAFGTKAGDTFTRITIGVASFWIVLCMVAAGTMKHDTSRVSLPGSGVTAGTPAGEEGAGVVPPGTAPAGAAPAESPPAQPVPAEAAPVESGPTGAAGGSAPAPAGESQ